MRFIHVADIHASRERLPQTLSILETLTERAKEKDIDFIIFAGDFWDSTITATKGSGFSDIIAAIKELEKYTQLIFVYGTPTHEPNGSLDAFMSDRTYIARWPDTTFSAGFQTEIIAIPEPRRSDYVAASSSDIDVLINKTIKDFIKKNEKLNEKLFRHRIVIYHGEVKGAVYQNGVSASSPTAISKELLQSLNADYYALGHIHMPQEIFPNAWYPGSACPKNFGETHDGHYNLVTIEDGNTEVKQVSFGLPWYVTFYERPDNFIEGNPHQNENANIRFVFDCTKEERKQMNIKAYADEIKERLRALSVKIEPNVIESDAVPVSEVSKRKSIVEKMTEYAKEKQLKIPKYAKELLQDIEDNTLAKLAYPQHSFELLSLSLRGAIGIRDGQHKEDFELNFETLEDGVVCLAGKSGVGKSTILENCHPYPCMLTREGTLKDHFYLKDSHRILVYKDENGLFYRISILIDAKTATGKTSYYVETSKNREVWKSVPEVDGSSDAYKKWVDSTFGSIDVFLRTAFFAKEQTKGTPDIAVTTKSERMELLSKLAGTEHLKEVSEIAREKRKDIEKEADKLSDELEDCESLEYDIDCNEQEIKTRSEMLEKVKNSISSLEKEIADLKVKDAEYHKSKALSEANKALYDQYQKEFEEKQKAFEEYDDALSSYGTIEKIIEYKKLAAENKKKIPEFQKQIREKRDEVSKQNEKLNTLLKEKDKKRKEYNRLSTEIKLIEQQIVPISDICPTCGARLSDEKYNELNKVIEENKKKLSELKEERSKYIVEEDDNDWTIVPIKSNIKELNDEINTLDFALSEMIDKSDEAASYIDMYSDLEKFSDMTKDEIEERANTLRAKAQELDEKMDSIIYEDNVEDVSEELAEKEQELKKSVEEKSELAASIKSAEKENEKYRKELKATESKRKELKELEAKITAYEFIEDAFSNNGIPAIELRESAPEIALITNKILKESHGSKFEIRFGSTSELKAKRKVNEDFNILVYDSENDDEKTIDLVSSGEKIWIKQALFYAFSIVQMNRTGFNFRTRLIDESDGSLDGASRPKYMSMVESAHKYSSSRITLMITHSQEIKDIAGQILEI